MSEYPKIILDKTLQTLRYRIVQKAENYCTIEHADGVDSMGVTRWKIPSSLDPDTVCVLIQYLLFENCLKIKSENACL